MSTTNGEANHGEANSFLEADYEELKTAEESAEKTNDNNDSDSDSDSDDDDDDDDDDDEESTAAYESLVAYEALVVESPILAEPLNPCEDAIFRGEPFDTSPCMVNNVIKALGQGMRMCMCLCICM